MVIFKNDNLCSLSQWKALSSSSTNQTFIISAESCLLALTTTSPHPNQSECTTDSFGSQTYSIWTLHFPVLFIFYAHFILNKWTSEARDPHPLCLSLINLPHDGYLDYDLFFSCFEMEKTWSWIHTSFRRTGITKKTTELVSKIIKNFFFSVLLFYPQFGSLRCAGNLDTATVGYRWNAVEGTSFYKNVRKSGNKNNV